VPISLSALVKTFGFYSNPNFFRLYIENRAFLGRDIYRPNNIDFSIQNAEEGGQL